MKNQNSKKVTSAEDAERLVAELESQINNLKETIGEAGNKKITDENDLARLIDTERDIQYKKNIVDRMYEKKGIMYSMYVKLPLRIMNVGSLKDSQKFMRDSYRSVASPMCVMCNKGIMMHSPDQLPIDGKVKWFCSNDDCGYTTWAESANSDIAMKDIRQKLNESVTDLGRGRWEKLGEEEKNELIKSHLSKARMFKLTSIGLGVAILLEMIMQWWWAASMMVGVVLLTVFMSIKWCYRAWQIKTGNVFQEKPMFIEWLNTAEDYFSVDWVDQDKKEDNDD